MVVHSRPLSNSLSTDILVLTSLLYNVPDQDESPISRNTEDRRLGLLTAIAILFTAWQSNSTPLSDVHVVLGHMDSSVFKCILLTNYPPTGKEMTQGSVPLNLKPNFANGRSLMNKDGVPNSYVVANSSLLLPSSISSRSNDPIVHVQDVFDVISFLRQTHRRSIDLRHFLVFIHTRSYHSLRARFLDLNKHWKVSPFEVMTNHIGAITDRQGFTKEFQIAADNTQLLLIEKHGLVGIPDSSEAWFDFTVNPENAKSWVELFAALWRSLEVELLHPSMARKPADKLLDRSVPRSKALKRMEVVCLLIATFNTLKPILQHLLIPSALGFRSTLGVAFQHAGNVSIHISI